MRLEKADAVMTSTICIQKEDFDPAAEVTSLTEQRCDVGAVVAFTGLCRGEGGRLAALELEHYPGMAEAEIERVMTEMSQARPEGVALMAKSNAGMPRWKDDRITYGGTPEVMADYARKMRELGVRVIGGCCGSAPEHIAAMRAALPKA